MKRFLPLISPLQFAVESLSLLLKYCEEIARNDDICEKKFIGQINEKRHTFKYHR